MVLNGSWDSLCGMILITGLGVGRERDTEIIHGIEMGSTETERR